VQFSSAVLPITPLTFCRIEVVDGWPPEAESLIQRPTFVSGEAKIPCISLWAGGVHVLDGKKFFSLFLLSLRFPDTSAVFPSLCTCL